MLCNKRLLGMVPVVFCAFVVTVTHTCWAGEVIIRPYIWALNINGNLAIDDEKIPLDVKTDEILHGAKIGGMGYLEWSNDHHLVFIEGIYADFDEGEFEQFNNQPLVATLTTVAIAYGRWFEIPVENMRLAPFIGVQYIKLDAAVKTMGLDISEEWVDPTLGLSGKFSISPRLSFSGKINTGGFGQGAAHAYDGFAVLKYQIYKNAGVVLGYRYADYKYRSKDKKITLDLAGTGPLIGLELMF